MWGVLHAVLHKLLRWTLKCAGSAVACVVLGRPVSAGNVHSFLVKLSIVGYCGFAAWDSNGVAVGAE
jgi:hypothetical protein